VNNSRFSKIAFRITLESKAILDVNSAGQPVQLGSSLLGHIRWAFRNLLGSNTKEEHNIFGDSHHRGTIIANEMTFHGNPEIEMRVSLDRMTGAAKEDSLYQEVLVPAGAMIIGSVQLLSSAPQRYETLIRSAILGMEQSGIGKNTISGYGRCHVEYIDLNDLGSVFISYTREDNKHKEWVLQLADRLTKDGLTVIFDEYDLKYGDNLHVYMEESVQRAKKTLVILTPLYKEKAEGRHGGAGYEYSMINSQLFDSLHDNKKVIPILRKGSFNDSTPIVLAPFYACDMTGSQEFEKKYSELYSSIMGKSSVTRPTCRI